MRECVLRRSRNGEGPNRADQRAAEFNDRVASTRSELQHDIVLAGAKANEIVLRAEQANRHPVMLRWIVLGTVAAPALFLIGLWTAPATLAPENSDLRCRRLLRIERGKTLNHGHPAKFLVRRNEHRNETG